MNHLWQDESGVIHLCDGGILFDIDPMTYVVWTLCGKDVPAIGSFKSKEQPTCQQCIIAGEV